MQMRPIPTRNAVWLGLFGVLALMFAAPSVSQAQSKKKRGKIIKRSAKNGRKGLYFRYGLGVGKCTGDDRLCLNPEIGPSWADLELGYRVKHIAFEGQFTHNFFDSSVPGLGGAQTTVEGQLIEGGVGLKVFPLLKGQADPYLGVRVGGMSVIPNSDNPDAESYGGFSTGVVGGVDFFLTKSWAVGLSGGHYWLFLPGAEGDENNQNAAATAGTEPEEGTAWTARISTIFYFGMGSSSRKRTKKAPKKARPRRKKKKPAY